MKMTHPSRTKDFLTFAGVILAFFVVYIMRSRGMLTRSLSGQLVPICAYVVMAISLNLTVGVLGELSLGHAGFMSVGAFSGVVAAMSLVNVIPSPVLRLVIAMVVGAIFAAIAGVIVGVPVLRLQGDYLAIVTLAFGEIIKDLINCLIVGVDGNGLHILFNATGSRSVADLHMLEGGKVIIKGAQGATGVKAIATFPAGVVLILLALVIVLNLMHSRSGRAIMALRDNRIAAESVGINVTKYKMMAFVTSAALAGAAGALYGLNFSTIVSSKFNFNTSITVLVFVVLGGLGNMTGSIIAAAVLTILPEALRGFDKYRMLAYAIVLIVVMLGTNNAQVKALLAKLIPHRKKGAEEGA